MEANRYLVKPSRYFILGGFLISAATIGSFCQSSLLAAQPHHQHSHKPTKQLDKTPESKKLLPAEGASIKILSPKREQTFASDQIPLHFALTKGRRGHHVHAYVDGELMGMFESEKGTLTGIKSGKHMLELRIVAEDHQSEL